MIIKCTQTKIELEFSEREGLTPTSKPNYFLVTLKTEWASSFTRVYVYDLQSFGLVIFFEDLAVNWRGFEGEKKWTSLEKEFSMICTSDKLGHFAIRITIRNSLGTLSIKTIYVEAGQLETIAREIKTFLNVPV